MKQGFLFLENKWREMFSDNILEKLFVNNSIFNVIFNTLIITNNY